MRKKSEWMSALERMALSLMAENIWMSDYDDCSRITVRRY